MLSADEEKKVRSRLNRIEGQIRGINRMVHDRKYCIDILTQIAAARRALDKVSLLIMRQHMRTCLTTAIKESNGEPKIEEIINAIDHFTR